MNYLQKILVIISVSLTVNLLAMDANSQLTSALLEYNYAQAKLALDNGALVNKIVDYQSGMTFFDKIIIYAKQSIKFLAPHKDIEIVPIVELLIEKGADVNAQGYWGYTPLMLAEDSPEIVELLLRYGADPKKVNSQGTSALDSARNYYFSAYDLFLFYPPLLQEVQEHPSKILLYHCMEKGYFTLVRLLLEKGVTVILADFTRAQALYKQTRTIRSSIIVKLLESKISQYFHNI